VCRLRLDDIDWAEEKIYVRRSKQRKVQTYPLTIEVGNALLRYLKEVRPRCAPREVLLTLRRPYRPVSVGAFSTMTQKVRMAGRNPAVALWAVPNADHCGAVSARTSRVWAKARWLVREPFDWQR
jgi:integrase